MSVTDCSIWSGGWPCALKAHVDRTLLARAARLRSGQAFQPTRRDGDLGGDIGPSIVTLISVTARTNGSPRLSVARATRASPGRSRRPASSTTRSSKASSGGDEAAAVRLAGEAFNNGGARAALSDAKFATVNPAPGWVPARVAACEAADADLAVARARGVRRLGLVAAPARTS